MGKHLKLVQMNTGISEAIRCSRGTTGLSEELEASEVARGGLASVPSECDHAHLAQHDGTPYCQWLARSRDGGHRAYGPVYMISDNHFPEAPGNA